MRILLALDDSKFSEAVTNALITQTKTEGVEVRLIHVIEPFPASLAKKLGSRAAPDFVAARQDLREQGRKLLGRAAQKLRSLGFKVSSSVEEGDARDIILNDAESWNANLIMVGSHGRTGLDRLLMGSVSETVARYAVCSVEIVRIRPQP